MKLAKDKILAFCTLSTTTTMMLAILATTYSHPVQAVSCKSPKKNRSLAEVLQAPRAECRNEATGVCVPMFQDKAKSGAKGGTGKKEDKKDPNKDEKKPSQSGSEGCAEGAAPEKTEMETYLGIDMIKLALEKVMLNFIDQKFFEKNYELNEETKARLEQLANANDTTAEKYDYSLKAVYKMLREEIRQNHPDVEPKSNDIDPTFDDFKRWVLEDGFLAPMLVTNIHENSPAHGKLEVGDILLMINGKIFYTDGEMHEDKLWNQEVEKSISGDDREKWQVEFNIIRGNVGLRNIRVWSGGVRPDKSRENELRAKGEKYKITPLPPRAELPKTVDLSAPKSQKSSKSGPEKVFIQAMAFDTKVDQEIVDQGSHIVARVGLTVPIDKNVRRRYVFVMKVEKSGAFKSFFFPSSNADKKAGLEKTNEILAQYLRYAIEFYRLELPSEDLLKASPANNPFARPDRDGIVSVEIDASKVIIHQRSYPRQRQKLDEFILRTITHNDSYIWVN